MKKVVSGIIIMSLLAIGATALAHGPRSWGGSKQGAGYGCYGPGPGYGCSVEGPGYGRHMGRWSGDYDKKFLDETADLRKELHDKRFEYSEATRDPKTEPETITKLENEIRALQDKISEKAPRTAYGRHGGYGCRW